ncbi:MAG TPA: hypothetical protein PK095_01435, partial [Myxococcota bacterium]|nr:hypothetical protein [Myxococcota bacterium]
RDYPRLSGKAQSPAVSRAEALLAELDRRAQHPVDWTAARESNVVSLAAARTHKKGRLGPRLAIFGVLAATIAAAAFIA